MTDSRPVTTTTKDSPEPGATPSGTTAPPEPAASHGGPDATGTARPRVHFPGLEGLRALAAVMVVVHHAVATPDPASTGRPLRRRRRSWTPAWRSSSCSRASSSTARSPSPTPRDASRMRAASFWWRRVLRIVPAYWLALTFFWKVLPTYDLGDQWWRYYLFLQIYWPGHDDRRHHPGLEPLHRDVVLPAHPVLGDGSWRSIAKRVAAASTSTSPAASSCSASSASRSVKWRHGARGAGPGAPRPPTFQWLPANIDLFAIGMARRRRVGLGRSRTDRLRRFADRVTAWAEPWWARGDRAVRLVRVPGRPGRPRSWATPGSSSGSSARPSSARSPP